MIAIVLATVNCPVFLSKLSTPRKKERKIYVLLTIHFSMEIVQIAEEILNKLDLYIQRDRTPGAFEFHPSNPGILRMVKKTFYKPNIREFTTVSNVSMIGSGGGQFIPGKTFEDNSVARFCQYFLDRNEELVTKFKDTFREITHPYYSNELQDEIAVSVLVYRYTERILSALLKDEKTRWSKKR